MKNVKIVRLLLLIMAVIPYLGIAQIDIGFYPIRSQSLNQYTSVFICSPNSGTIIQNIHNDDSPANFFNSDRFYEYLGGYSELPQDPPAETIMAPGRGYVFQLGGNGTIGGTALLITELNFGNSGANNGPISVSVSSNQFNLLGNP